MHQNKFDDLRNLNDPLYFIFEKLIYPIFVNKRIEIYKNYFILIKN